MKQNKGFMLVELLVVLAVLALLAAVAVPNFTRAQERAKVSRVHADLQTIAVALESYAADHSGKYPLHGFPEEYGEATVQAFSSSVLTGIITTPVAYLSSLSITLDPDTQNSPAPFPKQHWAHLHYNYHCFQAPWNDYNPTSRMFAQRTYGLWRLAAAGPDGSHFLQSPGVYSTISYDPTNGATSTGDIYRTQLRPEFNKAS